MLTSFPEIFNHMSQSVAGRAGQHLSQAEPGSTIKLGRVLALD